MSDTEASAQSSATAEKTSENEAPVSGTTTQDEPLTGSDEATKRVTDIDSYRNEVDALAAPPTDGGDAAEGDHASADGDDNAGDDSTESSDEGSDEEQGGGESAEEENSDESEDAGAVEEDPDDNRQSPEKKPPQYRFRPEDEVEALAFDIKKRAQKAGKKVTLEDALTQAKTILGADTKEEGGTEYPDSIEGSKAMLADLRAQRKKAFASDLDFELVADLDEKIDALKDHIGSLNTAESEALRKQEAEWDSTLEKSKGAAVTAYPDCTNPASALVKEMNKIDAALKETENPLYHSPEKPFKLAQMAANNLGIAPKTAASAPAKPAASSQPVKKPAAAATAARPAKPASPPMSGCTVGQIAASALDEVQDEDSWRAAVDKFKTASAA
mgnify:CR=1 FL=1